MYLDSCEFCHESFPSEDFVNLHVKIFHSVSKVTPVFVDEGEDLMTSFDVPVPSSKPKVGKRINPQPGVGGVPEKPASTAKSCKYGLRKK